MGGGSRRLAYERERDTETVRVGMTQGTEDMAVHMGAHLVMATETANTWGVGTGGREGSDTSRAEKQAQRARDDTLGVWSWKWA